MEKTRNCWMNMVRFWSPELSTCGKLSPKQIRKIMGGSAHKTQFLEEGSICFGFPGVSDFPTFPEGRGQKDGRGCLGDPLVTHGASQKYRKIKRIEAICECFRAPH